MSHPVSHCSQNGTEFMELRNVRHVAGMSHEASGATHRSFTVPLNSFELQLLWRTCVKSPSVQS